MVSSSTPDPDDSTGAAETMFEYIVESGKASAAEVRAEYVSDRIPRSWLRQQEQELKGELCRIDDDEWIPVARSLLARWS